MTGYKAMLEADAAKGHEDAADRLQNLGQLVNNVKNYCDQHGEDASLEATWRISPSSATLTATTRALTRWS